MRMELTFHIQDLLFESSIKNCRIITKSVSRNRRLGFFINSIHIYNTVENTSGEVSITRLEGENQTLAQIIF